MKKVFKCLLLLLIIVPCAIAMVACGGKDDPKPKSIDVRGG